MAWEHLVSRYEEVRAAGGGGQVGWGHAALLLLLPRCVTHHYGRLCSPRLQALGQCH